MLAACHHLCELGACPFCPHTDSWAVIGAVRASPGSRSQLDSVGKTRMADNQEDSAASPGLGWRILKVFEGINEVPRKV